MMRPSGRHTDSPAAADWTSSACESAKKARPEGGEALSTGLRLPSTTPPASHWLSPEPHGSRVFPAKQPLLSEGLAASAVCKREEEEELQRAPLTRLARPAARASRVTGTTEPRSPRELRVPSGVEWGGGDEVR